MSQNNMDFEKALKRLEEIILLLEQGDLKLNEALDLFNEGVNMIKLCNKDIEDAKEHVSAFLVEEGFEIPWDEWKD